MVKVEQTHSRDDDVSGEQKSISVRLYGGVFKHPWQGKNIVALIAAIDRTRNSQQCVFNGRATAWNWLIDGSFFFGRGIISPTHFLFTFIPFDFRWS